MALASQTRSTSDLQRGLLRRPSQNSTSSLSSPVVETVDFCRSKPSLVELENQLYSLANGNGKLPEVMKTCQSLLLDFDNVNGIFNVFCSCSWVDRYKDPIISQLFYELINVQCDSSNGTFLLAELETACGELLKVLTLLGTPNTLQFNVVSLLYNLSQLSGLPSLHQEAVQSYLEEIARALWPYSMASAPNLWISDAFCDAQCDILKACGKFHEEKCPVNTERTFRMINGKLISGDISKYSRFRLLEIRELRACGWKVSAATLNYYKASYLKLINQSRKDNTCMLVNDVHEADASRNDLKRINSIGENMNETNDKPVKVVRISENELRKSCDNMQQELVTQGITDEEENIEADHKSFSSVDCEELPAEQTISLNGGIEDCLAVEKDTSVNDPLNAISSKGNPILHRSEARQSTENGSTSHSSTISRKVRSSCQDGDEVGVVSDAAKEGMGYPTVSHVSHDLIEDSLNRAPSPCSSDGSDDVFAGRHASAELNIAQGNKVLPASHRGDFKKPRRPFKSDSSVTSITESLGTRTAVLSDSKESKCSGYPTFARSHSTDLTNSSKVPVQSVIDQVSSITFNDSQVDQSSKGVTENWRETKLLNVDKSDGSVTDSWRERPSVDLKEPESNAPNGNLRERKLSSTDKSDVDGHSSVTDNWRQRPSVDLKEPENTNTSNAHNGNWREKKLSSTDKSDVDGQSSVTDNWRERPSVDLKEPETTNTSNAHNGNWRERKSDHADEVQSSGSGHDNWRDRKSMSVDESTRSVNSTCTASQRSKRYSTGDVQLERQNSNEKGKHSPGGGFGFPKPAKKDDHTVTPSDEPPKQELVEVQITEEESQGLRWKKLEDIQIDTGCNVFHNRFKYMISIRGDPQQCKVAKKRVYSVVAALQEEFGALVPLSDEVLEHLQIEGCNMLAERLALSSAASVKMINDTQLFISGHRICVNLAKAQLAKIKVMLRYTDDPDVESPSQQDNSEEKYQRVEKLFATLEGRPRSLTDTSAVQAPTEGGLSRDFLLSCALSPVARQRPVDLNLDRTEDWIKDIVLVAGRRGEQAVLKGFGRPDSNSRRPSN